MKAQSLFFCFAVFAASLLGAANDRPAGQPAAANTEPPARFSLKGKVALGDVFVFNVKPGAPARKTEWLALGETIDGYTLSAYDHPTDTLTLKKGDENLRVPMDIAPIIATALTPAERQKATLDRMARMKPALEAGQPIRSHALAMLNGHVLEQPVEFVMGRETRLEMGDEGTFLITPKLNPDGSVAYDMAVQAKGSTGPATQLPRVITAPWSEFSLMADHGWVLAFQPEADGKP